ncbi:MAG: hypothetical protein ACOX1F_01010 [Erysipelotrichaceae bacterium]
MQKALEADMSVINEDGSYEYVDNEPETPTETITNKLVKEEAIEQKPTEMSFFDGASW